MAINLNNPQVILAPAVKIDITSIQLTEVDVRIKMNWLDATGNVVKSGSITLTGADFTDIVTAKVEANHVDKRISRIFKRTVTAKIKSMLSVDGSIDDA